MLLSVNNSKFIQLIVDRDRVKSDRPVWLKIVQNVIKTNKKEEFLFEIEHLNHLFKNSIRAKIVVRGVSFFGDSVNNPQH